MFVGRDGALRDIANSLLLENNPQPVVIAGEGGIGKTQLAAEFAFRYGVYFSAIHWLNASKPETIDVEIVKCGRAMGIENWPNSIPEQVQFTLAEWENNLYHLVILDDVENFNTFQTLISRFRKTRILATSRWQDWPSYSAIKVVKLDMLKRLDSIKLLKGLAKYLNEFSDEEVSQIAKYLGDFPLALHISGRYINKAKVSPKLFFEELNAAGGLLE